MVKKPWHWIWMKIDREDYTHHTVSACSPEGCLTFCTLYNFCVIWNIFWFVFPIDNFALHSSGKAIWDKFVLPSFMTPRAATGLGCPDSWLPELWPGCTAQSYDSQSCDGVVLSSPTTPRQSWTTQSHDSQSSDRVVLPSLPLELSPSSAPRLMTPRAVTSVVLSSLMTLELSPSSAPSLMTPRAVTSVVLPSLLTPKCWWLGFAAWQRFPIRRGSCAPVLW